MKFKFTIGRKIGIGFGILISTFLICSLFFFYTLNKSKKINDNISKVYTPSLSLIEELNLMIANSKQLIGNWIFIQRNDNVLEKSELKQIHNQQYPKLKKQLTDISELWKDEEKQQLDSILLYVDSLFSIHKSVMLKLNSFESYEDPFNVFAFRPMMDQEGVITIITKKIQKQLTSLKEKQQLQSNLAQSEMLNSLSSFKNFILLLGLLFVLFGFTISFYTIRSITKPVIYARNIMLLMGKGQQPEEIIISGKDEIGEMSVALKSLNEGLKKTTDFAKKIGEGKLDIEFTPLSNEDVLGNSLLEMRKSLKIAYEEDNNRKIEEEKRNWTIKGIALFGDILRTNNDDLEVLANEIISNLVKYTNANQGALYLLSEDNDEEPTIELISCYAWSKKKHYLDRKIPLGEDLAGQCVLDKETIYLTDVPDKYVFITSGLGGENPRNLILVPLKINDVVFGVIELASFKYFEKYMIAFVEKVGESIASTISSVRVNIKTAILLEQSQMQAETLKAQEEEMRQNMEELAATQEAMAEKERNQLKEIEELRNENNERLEKIITQTEQLKIHEDDLKNTIEQLETYKLDLEKKSGELEWNLQAINKTIAVLEYDFDGVIINANEVFCKIMQYQMKEIVGKHHSIFFDNKDFKQTKAYMNFWQTMKNGEHYEGVMKRIAKDQSDVIVKGICSPQLDKNGNPVKVMEFVTDITSLENEIKHLKTQIKEFSEK